MSIAQTILNKSIPITIKRTAPSSYVDGLLVNGTTTEISSNGSVQPAGGKDLERLPEGQRTGEVLKVYMLEEVFPTEAEAGSISDIISFMGRDYQVEKVDRWYVQANYYKAIVRRIGN